MGQSGQRPGVAIPGQISMSLPVQSIKSAHALQPAVVGLAGEQPATGLAGLDQAVICVKYAKNMQ